MMDITIRDEESATMKDIIIKDEKTGKLLKAVKQVGEYCEGCFYYNNGCTGEVPCIPGNSGFSHHVVWQEVEDQTKEFTNELKKLLEKYNAEISPSFNINEAGQVYVDLYVEFGGSLEYVEILESFEIHNLTSETL